MTLINLRRSGIALVLFALFAPIRATAQVYVYLAVDPPTTAGFDVPVIPREFGTGSFSVTSTKSGPGTWHLYALDDVEGSFGIAGFMVNVVNSSDALNRSPFASYTNYGDVDEHETLMDSYGEAGFSDLLVRSGYGLNQGGPVQGNQLFFSPHDIPGFGISASNLNNTPNIPAPGDHRVWGGVVSGQWGNYATDPAPINGKNWLFLGEGDYSGTVQLGFSHFNHYWATNPLLQAYLPQASIKVFDGSAPTNITGVPEPSTISLLGFALAAFCNCKRRRR